MKTTMTYKRFFAFSESKNKYFNTKFNKSINIVHGKNTSGKSTLIQSILYTFGINDEKYKLAEVLEDGVIFRIDFDLLKNNIINNYSIIRDNELVVIVENNKLLKKFTGIGGNNSGEHKLLKYFYSDLFGFKLNLELTGEYKQASIEAMFLPYYVAQDIGWVSRLKSFRGLDFVKNFKNDFFDYYLGITNDLDRNKKIELELQKKTYQDEINTLNNIETNDIKINITKLIDENFEENSTEYLDVFKSNKSKLIELEKEYLLKCNELAKLEQRKTILLRVKRALKKQTPSESKCPTCHQPLPENIEKIYEHFQNINDTDLQFEEVNNLIDKLKKTKGRINSLKKDIESSKTKISKDYDTLKKYSVENVTFDTWIDQKATTKYIRNISEEREAKIKLLNTVVKGLKKYKTDEEVLKDRNSFDYSFKIVFEKSLKDLGVEKFKKEQFLFLYKISAFPKQGVELLKTLLAYNFSFNKIISKTKDIHRFPFLLDAVFEGDVEEDNRGKILEFINSNKPTDTQTIITIADSKTNTINVDDYNKNFFNNKAHLICIGNNEIERSFLQKYDNNYDNYIEDTMLFLE